MLSRFILMAFILVSAVYANADEVLAQTHFLTRNGNKEFSVQHFSSRNLYIVHFGLLWSNFDQTVHSNGYKLSDAQVIHFVSPALPEKCQLADSATARKPVLGYLNGVDAGSNLLQLVLKGKTCDQYVEQLKQMNFVVTFEDVPAMQSGAPLTESLRLEVLDLP